MPYIKKGLRKALDAGLTPLASGDMNYVITKLINQYIGDNPTYSDYNDAIGVLELYRRRVATFEDIKKKQNGDVYP